MSNQRLCRDLDNYGVLLSISCFQKLMIFEVRKVSKRIYFFQIMSETLFDVNGGKGELPVSCLFTLNCQDRVLYVQYFIKNSCFSRKCALSHFTFIVLVAEIGGWTVLFDLKYKCMLSKKMCSISLYFYSSYAFNWWLNRFVWCKRYICMLSKKMWSILFYFIVFLP